MIKFIAAGIWISAVCCTMKSDGFGAGARGFSFGCVMGVFAFPLNASIQGIY